MKRWKVNLYYSTFETVEIEAATEGEAHEQALMSVVDGNHNDVELLNNMERWSVCDDVIELKEKESSNAET